jgi:predicted ATP-grasp superfamily ATP-dependent carboligase
LKIVVCENVSGGGYAGQQIQPGLLAEGFGMLRTFASDLKAVGHEVSVLLDSRILKMNPPMDVDCTVPIFGVEELRTVLPNVAKISDAAYIIAPETGQTLRSIVQLIEQTGKISLNCQSEAVQKVSDKTVLHAILEKNYVQTPETLVIDIADDLVKVEKTISSKLNYPAIFKPMDGVSCSGLSILRNEREIEKAIEKIKSESAGNQFIAQEFVQGQAVSVILIVAGNKAMAISLNEQNVNLASPDKVSSYEGGVVPFEHPLKQQAFMAAEQAVKLFPGLRGYVGVDLILTDDEVFVVDLNPRLTTSYIGVRKTVKFNVAQTLIDAVLKGKLPCKNENQGFVSFLKVETPKPSSKAFQKTAKLTGLVSPPFPLDNAYNACSLVAGYGNSLEAAWLQFEEAKKHLLNIVLGRGK